METPAVGALLLLLWWCLASSANGGTVSVTSAVVERAWQSSSNGNSRSHCFTNTMNRIGQWDYFRSSDSTTDGGYQWLLVKLRRPMRVRSVTLQGSASIEVRLAENLTGSVLTPTSSCYGSLNHMYLHTSFRQCGTTGHSRRSVVQCGTTRCSQLTNYILLRKYTGQRYNRYRHVSVLMNLEYMAINEDDSLAAVSRSHLVRTWQSSSWRFGSHSSCFWSQRSPSSPKFFQSGSWATADDGFHWFLLQLKRPALLWQVQIQATGGNNEERSAAASVQVYYAGVLPGNLMQQNSCHADWMSSFRPDAFSFCGATKASGLVAAEQLTVSCCSLTSHMRAAVILLRKPADSRVNMSFASMRILTTEASRFLVCRGAGHLETCDGEGRLKLLTDGEAVTVQVQLPCSMFMGGISSVTVSILRDNGTAISPGSASQMSSTKFSFRLTGHLGMQGATLKAGYQCNDGSRQSLSDTLGFVVPPRSVNLSLYDAPYWLVGRAAEFSFVTDYALPEPTHRCQLIDSSGAAHSLLPTNQKQQELPLTSSASYVKLRSEFNLSVAGSYENGTIRCQSGLLGTDVTVTRQLPVPLFYFPCRTNFVLPANTSWKDGATLSLTVDSSDSNKLATSHTCSLQSDLGRASLRSISTTNTSSTYSVTVTRQWGSAASVVCLVNQSGLIETWTRQLLPSVLYAASIHLTLSTPLIDGRDTEFNVSVSAGQPTPSVACGVHWDGRSLGIPLSSSLTGGFTPSRDMHGGQLQCVMTQRVGSELVFSRSANSSLHVLCLSNTSWTASDPLVSMEGATESVTVTSVGGDPAPTAHSCRILMANGTAVPLGNEAKSGPLPLVTNISFVSLREFDQSQLVCFAVQQGIPRTPRLTQDLTVYYAATIDLSVPDVLEEGDTTEFNVSVSEGQPPSVTTCNVVRSSGRTEQIQLTANLTGSLTVERRMHWAELSCSVEQHNGSHTIFSSTATRNLTVHFTTGSSWTAEQPLVLKEGEVLKVAVTSGEGNPEPSQRCWLEAADGSELQLRPQRTHSNGSALVSQFATPAVRRFNTGALKCSVSQEGRPFYGQNFTQRVTVYFSGSTIRWSGQLTRGTELLLTVLTEEGNPRPELDCSLKSETVSIDRLTMIPESETLGDNGGWIRRVQMWQRFMEPQPEVTVTCAVSQYLEPSRTRIFGPAKNHRRLRADYSVRTLALLTTAAAPSTTATAQPAGRSAAVTRFTTAHATPKANSRPPTPEATGAASESPQAAAADAGCHPHCHRELQEAGGRIGLVLTLVAVVFAAGLAAGTYRCLSRRRRSFEVVAMALQVRQQSRPCQQGLQEDAQERTSSVPNQYDEES